MTTPEAIVQELQQVPPQHPGTVYQLVHALTGRPAQETIRPVPWSASWEPPGC